VDLVLTSDAAWFDAYEKSEPQRKEREVRRRLFGPRPEDHDTPSADEIIQENIVRERLGLRPRKHEEQTSR